MGSVHQAGYEQRHCAQRISYNGEENGELGMMLVDFDWAGVIGEVRYLINVNIGSQMA